MHFKRPIAGIVIALLASSTNTLSAQPTTPDEKSEAQIRRTLASWVDASNRKDKASANSIWAAKLVGWFPQAAEFSDSAASATAGLPEKKGDAYSTFAVTIDDLAVSGSIAAVHDIWQETRHFKGSEATVERIIHGSELWRLQPDGTWKIARFVSVPEKWENAQPVK